MGKQKGFYIGGPPPKIYTEEGLPGLSDSPERPDESAVLWRYMNLERYVCMLMDEGIFFSNPLKFNDPFEASLPHSAIKRLTTYHTDRKAGAQTARILQTIVTGQYDVCCWHEMEHESDAMWKIYAERNTGIAIKTDYSSLLRALWGSGDPYERCLAGRVAYIDYNMDDISVLNVMPLFHKRKSFSHEREVRIACATRFDENRSGQTLNADLCTFIHDVVVSPIASDWEFNVVKKTTCKFNETIATRVRKSEITMYTPAAEILGTEGDKRKD